MGRQFFKIIVTSISALLLMPILIACSDAKVKVALKSLMNKTGSQGPYLRLEVDQSWVLGSSKGLLTSTYCHPAKLKLYQGNGQTYLYNGALPLSVNWSNPIPLGAALYNEASCTTLETHVSIANGGITNSSTQLYVKATTNMSDLGFSFTMSDPAISYESNWNLFDVRSPKLKASLPSRVVFGTGICYSGRVERQMANGWPYSPTAGLTVVMTTNASWNVDSSTCGSNNGSTYISPSMSSASFQYNPMSIGPHLITFTAAAYDSDALTIQTGAGQNLVDHFEVIPMGTATIGECVGLNIRLLNYDNAAVSTKSAFQIIAAPNSSNEGIFYSDSNCTTSSNIIAFPLGNSETKIGYRPLKVMTQSLRFIHPFYYLTDGTQSLSLPVVANMGGIYLNGTLPSFNGKKIIGSHEFGASQFIPLDYPADAILTCSTDDISYGSCSGWIDASQNFIWTLADAMLLPAPPIKWVKATNIFGERKIRMNLADVYGSNFKVIPCDTVVTTNINLDALEALYMLSYYNNVCVNSGVVITKESFGMQAILNGWDLKLVGHSDGTSTIDVGGYTSAPAALQFTSNTDNSVYIANLNWINIGQSTMGIYFDGSAVTTMPTQVLILNNKFSNVSGTAIQVGSTDLDYTFHINDNEFTLTPNLGSLTRGVKFLGDKLMFNFNKIAHSPYVDDTHGSVGLEISTTMSSPNYAIAYLKWTGAGTSIGLSMNGPTSGLLAPNLNLANSYFASYAEAGIISTVPVFIKDSNFTVESIAIVDPYGQSSTGQHNLLKLSNQTSLHTTNGVIQNSLLRFGGSAGTHLLFDFGGGAQHINLTNFANNQFVSNSSFGLDISSRTPIDNTYISSNTYLSAATLNGDNLFCSNSSYLWTNLTASPINLGPTLSFTSMKAMCTKSSNVSASGLCKSLCDP